MRSGFWVVVSTRKDGVDLVSDSFTYDEGRAEQTAEEMAKRHPDNVYYVVRSLVMVTSRPIVTRIVLGGA